MAARAVEDLRSDLSRLAGAPVALERPTRTEHGDYATNVAMQLAPQNGRPPRDLDLPELREVAEALAAQVTEL